MHRSVDLRGRGAGGSKCPWVSSFRPAAEAASFSPFVASPLASSSAS